LPGVSVSSAAVSGRPGYHRRPAPCPQRPVTRPYRNAPRPGGSGAFPSSHHGAREVGQSLTSCRPRCPWRSGRRPLPGHPNRES
jgi:hypothetical protein